MPQDASDDVDEVDGPNDDEELEEYDDVDEVTKLFAFAKVWKLLLLLQQLLVVAEDWDVGDGDDAVAVDHRYGKEDDD